MVIFFSGTGNSAYAAACIASYTHDDCIDSLTYMKKGGGGAFSGAKPWVFVCPTYAWRIPRIFERFILDSSFSGPDKAYFVMTCGDSIGDARAGIIKLCGKKGWLFMGVKRIIMPENYIAMFDVPGPEEAAAYVRNSRPELLSASEDISAARHFSSEKISIGAKLCSGVINPVFYKLFVKADSFSASGACSGCGLCVEKCPLNNISLAGGRPVWHKNCTHCMACICRCPCQAIEYGKKSAGKPRYTCPY